LTFFLLIRAVVDESSGGRFHSASGTCLRIMLPSSRGLDPTQAAEQPHLIGPGPTLHLPAPLGQPQFATILPRMG
jgi:hypothetical protein